MGYIVNATVTVMNLTDLTEEFPAYADVRIHGNVHLSERTAEDLGWAVLAEKSRIDPFILRGLLPAQVIVHEILPPWKNGWPQYICSYRASHAAPVDIEPLIKETRP